ncbi:MAG: hypothetical protein U0840_21380 [Gemmataceae bacterium]
MFQVGSRLSRRSMVLGGLASMLALVPGQVIGQETTKKIAPGTPVNIIVKPAEPSTPPVSITLGSRHGHATPERCGCTHTGGGTVDVQQPSSDTIVVTLTGLAVAYAVPKGSTASMAADLDQCFEINFDNPKVKRAKLTMEGRVVGVLRSHCKGGTASFSDANAAVVCETSPILTLSVEPHAVANGDNLSVNDRNGPVSVNVLAGKYKLHQTFRVSACSGKGLCGKAPSAEFSPEGLDPLWISYKEPFKGVSKKDFGFQLTIKVSDDTPAEEEKKNGNAAEPKAENKK